ncbi:type II toxin-antitoxin system RelE/ParE family toxin [Photorhabdus laumondii]|uniref:type II toxin-antitoxin system RelE/ParE family toxin n=1 Tax=Photorhabdus laumondii TaxID=2218628 RepID=UPI003314BEF9
MRIFTTGDFATFMNDNSLTSVELCQSVQEVINGLVDANLGGNLFKKRIALAKAGKSGSARSVVAFRYNDKIIFIDG